MAWGRLALIQAAGEADDASLQKMAKVFGYVKCLDDESLVVEKELDARQYAQHTGQLEQQDASPVGQQRPPARFLRVNKITRLNEHGKEAPVHMYDPEMRFQPDDTRQGTYRFEAPSPLLPMSRLIPFLLNSLGLAASGSQLDHRQLARQMALGKALRRLPRLPRQRWPQRLLIIVDAVPHLEPYWADFLFIIQQMEKLLGKEAVTSIRFDERCFEGDQLPRYVAWPRQRGNKWQRWKAPAADVPILILGDLGAMAEHASSVYPWRALAKALQLHPAPLLTLSPVAYSSRDRVLCRTFKPNPLNDVYRLPRHPGRDGFDLRTEARSTAGSVLTLLAALPLVDVGLLRRLRHEMGWGGSELEADIWNHPNVRRVSLGIRLDEAVAEDYRQDYQREFANTPLAERFWQVVQVHHAHAYEGLRQLEKLNQCVLENRDDAAMRDYLRRLCATAMQANAGSVQREALAMQCRTILTSMPESVWCSEHDDLARDLYALGYEADIRAGNWPEHLPKGLEPASFQWLLDTKARAETVQWLLVQTNDQGQFTLQQHNPDRPVHRPVATLEALGKIPPVLHFPLEPPIPVEEGAAFEIPDKVVVAIHSASHSVELEAITKPSWASRMWRDAAGLWASILWLGQEQNIVWKEAEDLVKSYWVWQPPFGEDDYGLYADLDIDGIPQRFRWIEPGTFLMGSPPDEPGREPHESLKGAETQHQVTLTQGFWLADTTVTQAQWQAVMGNNPSHFNGAVKINDKSLFIDGANHPVEKVSWEDAQAFITRLQTLIPGLNARLPTDAQWEYACRAGTTTMFNFEGDISLEKVNFGGYFDKAVYAEKARQATAAVKSYPPNAWGLFEMHGNVWEWCQDWWQQKIPAEPIIDPEGLNAGVERVVRGGSWPSDGRGVRSAIRVGYDPALRGTYIGFRLSLGLELRSSQGGGAAKQAGADDGDAGRRGAGDTADRGSVGSGGWVDNLVKGLKNSFRKKK